MTGQIAAISSHDGFKAEKQIICRHFSVRQLGLITVEDVEEEVGML